MKKYYQIIGVSLIMVFSFYYTEQIANLMLNKNPLMISINKEKDKYKTSSVNAIISGDYIIPGLNGLEVNAKESYYKMQAVDNFNKYYLVYDEIYPEISLEDNKDKMITKGNAKLKKVSFIIENNPDIKSYFEANNLKASILISLDDFKKKSFLEQINNDIDNFKTLDNNLNLSKLNKNICVVNPENKDICLKNKYYLVDPKLKLSSTNLISVKKSLENGSIILVKDSAKLDDVKILLKEVNFKGLTLTYLSDIINEKNTN